MSKLLKATLIVKFEKMGQKKSKHNLERAAEQAGGSGDFEHGKGSGRHKGILSIPRSKHHTSSSVYSNDILFGPLDLFTYTITQPVEILPNSEHHAEPLSHEDVLSGILSMAFPEIHPFCSKTDDDEFFYGHGAPEERKSAHEIAEHVISQNKALQWMMANFDIDLSEKGTESDNIDMFIRELKTVTELPPNETQEACSHGLDFAKSLLTRQQFVSFRKKVPDHIQLPDIYDCELGILYEINKVLRTQIRYKGEHKKRLTVYSDDISRSTSVVCEPDLVFINELSTLSAAPTRCFTYTSGITVKVHNPRKHALSPSRSMTYSKSVASVSSSHDTGIDLHIDYPGSVNIPSKYTNLPEKLIAALCDAIETADAGSNSILQEAEQNYLSLVHDLQQHVLELLSASVDYMESHPGKYQDIVYTLGLFVHNDDIYITRLVSNYARLQLCTAKDAEQFWNQQMRMPLKHTTGHNKSYPLVTFCKEPLTLKVPAHRMGLLVFLKYYNSMVNLSLLNKEQVK